MSYTALYRKFRPNVFAGVVGQDHIVKTLKNQMKTGRVSHAYLFCGTRGTGKTSTAKIFARAINCLHPTEDGEPCNECKVCQDILAGRSVNVMEIDAASNNSVDNIREIHKLSRFGDAHPYRNDARADMVVCFCWLLQKRLENKDARSWRRRYHQCLYMHFDHAAQSSRFDAIILHGRKD